MREDIQIGGQFPDYELPDHTGQLQRLTRLQGGDPMVLVLSRGYYCPKDRRQLMDLVPFSAHCKVGYTKLVTITTDTLLQVNELRAGLGADWTFLHDEKRVIQQDLLIQEYTDPEHDPMIPHTFVLAPGLRIFRLYGGYWFWDRPTPDELHQDLRALTREIRPDWKIDTPEMRARWERGDKAEFFPYGQPMSALVEKFS